MRQLQVPSLAAPASTLPPVQPVSIWWSTLLSYRGGWGVHIPGSPAGSISPCPCLRVTHSNSRLQINPIQCSSSPAPPDASSMAARHTQAWTPAAVVGRVDCRGRGPVGLAGSNGLAEDVGDTLRHSLLGRLGERGIEQRLDRLVRQNRVGRAGCVAVNGDVVGQKVLEDDCVVVAGGIRSAAPNNVLDLLPSSSVSQSVSTCAADLLSRQHEHCCWALTVDCLEDSV